MNRLAAVLTAAVSVVVSAVVTVAGWMGKRPQT